MKFTCLSQPWGLCCQQLCEHLCQGLSPPPAVQGFGCGSSGAWGQVGSTSAKVLRFGSVNTDCCCVFVQSGSAGTALKMLVVKCVTLLFIFLVFLCISLCNPETQVPHINTVG